jgi:hypothetical protein
MAIKHRSSVFAIRILRTRKTRHDFRLACLKVPYARQLFAFGTVLGYRPKPSYASLKP